MNNVKDLKFGESNTIYLPKQVDSVSGWLHTYHHKIYNFNFNEKAHYVIKKEMEIGPEGKLNNLSMCFKILKNTQDSLVFIDERFPNTLYKKRTLKE